MAKAAAINMSDTFSPPPQTHVVTPLSSFGDFLPSLPNPAGGGGPGPGPGSAASQRLSGHVKAVSAAKERISSGSSYGSKRQSGTIMSSVPLQPPAPHLSDGPNGGQQNAKLPPLLHGYTAGGAGGGGGAGGAGAVGFRIDSPSAPSQLGSAERHHGGGGSAGGTDRQQMEVLQPSLQHPAILPGPTPASHPYQPKRKPPSAFMRNNPMRQQLEASSAAAAASYNQPRSVSAGSTRSRATPLDSLGAASYGGAAAGHHHHGTVVDYGDRLPDANQAQQFAEEVMGAAEAAIAQGQANYQAWQEGGGGGGYGGGGGGGLGGFVAAPPWGVSSVSDLEALDSILDQLVVVDARMRKALLKGPLISFETVVPEHVMNAAAGRQPPQQQQPQDDKDRTFLTSVKGVDDGGGAGGAEAGEEAGPGAEASRPDDGPPLPPSPAELAEPPQLTARQHQQQQAAAAAALRGSAEEYIEPRDSSMFPAAIPNPGMHPTFTRAYLASKMATRPQHLPPPPPATAEHLLRSRPPPFIAAPTYDQLCSQIRDVQRQYTCGTARPAGQARAASAGPAGAGGAATAAAAAGALPGAATANQYIAGLDGPTLDEVVTHQELPISLERVRPTFVALKQKAPRAISPRRGPGSPGRQGTGGGLAEGLAAVEGVSGPAAVRAV